MATLDLTTQSNIQLELLLAKEQKFQKALSKVLIQVEQICQEELDMSLDQVCEAYEYSNDRLKALESEMQSRMKNN